MNSLILTKLIKSGNPSATNAEVYDLIQRMRAAPNKIHYLRPASVLPIDKSPKEYARELRSRGWSYPNISNICRLIWGRGCYSVVVRWCDDRQYQKHLAWKRKK